MPKISGLTILKNGITCGYTFVETLKCLDAICDEIIICEGNSTDGTIDYINRIKNDKFKIYSYDWGNCSDGTKFADITNDGLDKCTGEYIFYLQSDEIIHECEYDKVKSLINDGYDAIYMQFAHLRYTMLKKIQSNAYEHAIRIIKNKKGIRSITDGYNFGGEITSATYSNILVYHAGYVFLKNILQKMINHADSFYITNSNYQERKAKSINLLNRLNAGEQIDPEYAHQILEPFYTLVDHGCILPSLLQKHVGALSYNPEVNL
jgi:hypothetical protein